MPAWAAFPAGAFAPVPFWIPACAGMTPRGRGRLMLWVGRMGFCDGFGRITISFFIPCFQERPAPSRSSCFFMSIPRPVTSDEFFIGIPHPVTPAQAGVQERLTMPALAVLLLVLVRRPPSGFRPA
jgi:hypothetical protein